MTRGITLLFFSNVRSFSARPPNGSRFSALLLRIRRQTRRALEKQAVMRFVSFISSYEFGRLVATAQFALPEHRGQNLRRPCRIQDQPTA